MEASEKLGDGRGGSEKTKTKKNSEANSDDKKSQDNQTPKEQVRDFTLQRFFKQIFQIIFRNVGGSTKR